MITISLIKVELSEWMFNAGVVGFINILESNEESEVNITKKGNCIEFDSSLLDNFSEKYMNFFIDKYEIFTGWYRISNYKEKIIEIRNKDEYDSEDIKALNNHIKFLKKKLKSNSYMKAYSNISDKSVDLKLEEKRLTKIKISKKKSSSDVKKEVDEQLVIIENIIDYIRKEEVKKHLIAKDIAYNIISTFWNGVSFLHKSKSDKDIYEEYNSHFVKNVDEYIKQDKTKAKYSCLNCNSGIVKLDDAFNLSWIQNIGVDGAKKASHFWNLERIDTICPVCNLIYSCIPAGFIFLKGKGFFVNNNINVETLVKSNQQAIKSTDDITDLEYKSYLQIANVFASYEIRNIEKEYNNIQIVKVDTSNSFRMYSFNILSREIMKFLNENIKTLNFLLNKKIFWYEDGSGIKKHKSLYREVIDKVYKNENLFSLIDFTINKTLRGEYFGLNEIESLLVLNMKLMNGGSEIMKKISYAKVRGIRRFGNELRKEYFARGANKKLDGIQYRLSSALRVKDSSKFLDTLINMYSYVGKEIPVDFIDCLGSDDVFQTVGYAFVLGLEGMEEKSEDKNNKNIKNEREEN